MTNRNTIPLKPLGDRLVVLLDAKQAESTGGIIIPELAQEVPSWGTVISAGADAEHCIPQDRVYVPTHLGTSYVSGGVNIVIISESKVLAREERRYHVTPEHTGEIEESAPESPPEVADKKIIEFPVDSSGRLNSERSKTLVSDCSACGETHEVTFEKTDPIEIEGFEYNLVATCPVNGMDVFIRSND